MRKAAKLAAPPPRLLVSEWADQHRQLSKESAAEPGQWRTDKAPYQREMMDAVKEPEVKEVVFMTSSQVGKSEMLNNIIGYHVAHEPCPILLALPTLRLAEAYSKDRIAPMIRDTPAITDKFKDKRAKDSDNTILHKKYTGGHLTLVGANSTSSLSSRPISKLLMDELDRWPSTTPEGDPIKIVQDRTKNWHNAKQIMASSPTEAGRSKIEKAYKASDQRVYHVPCPHCGFEQPLKWEQIKWPKDSEGNHLHEAAFLECIDCEKAIDESYKLSMLKAGRWIARKPFKGIAGFHLNALYSPWVAWSRTVESFLKAKADPETLKVWTNGDMGEVWELEGEGVDINPLIVRREQYTPATLPVGVVYITAGVDVQGDRLEAEVVGWGLGEETWSIEYITIYGNPHHQQVYKQMFEALERTYTPAHGSEIICSSIAIDSGFATDSVYDFVRKASNRTRGVYATKGVGGEGLPIVGKPSKKTKKNVRLFPVGVDTCKARLYNRLNSSSPGFGYCHFPAPSGSADDDSYNEEYFAQLTSERLVRVMSRGRETYQWRKVRNRNEALDCRIYAMAALSIRKPNLEKIAKVIGVKVVERKEFDEPADNVESIEVARQKKTKKKKVNRRRKESWLKRGQY